MENRVLSRRLAGCLVAQCREERDWECRPVSSFGGGGSVAGVLRESFSLFVFIALV